MPLQQQQHTELQFHSTKNCFSNQIYLVFHPFRNAYFFCTFMSYTYFKQIVNWLFAFFSLNCNKQKNCIYMYFANVRRTQEMLNSFHFVFCTHQQSSVVNKRYFIYLHTFRLAIPECLYLNFIIMYV